MDVAYARSGLVQDLAAAHHHGIDVGREPLPDLQGQRFQQRVA